MQREGLGGFWQIPAALLAPSFETQGFELQHLDLKKKITRQEKQTPEVSGSRGFDPAILNDSVLCPGYILVGMLDLMGSLCSTATLLSTILGHWVFAGLLDDVPMILR